MSSRLSDLSHEERVACEVAERALGAVVTAWDVRPRQRAVDAMLDYPDGRRAAFEVTHLAADGGSSLQLASLLNRAGYRWPAPGSWSWIVWIGDPRDLRRLREIFDKIALLCEAAGVERPENLAQVERDADLQWLADESTVRMWGRATLPDGDERREARVTLTQPSVGGFVDHTFSGLEDVLSTAFATEHIRSHVEKLDLTPADERHLFLIVGVYDVPFPLFDALGSGDTQPANPPSLPGTLTHLWLAPVYGHRVLIGRSNGWIETRDIRPAT